MENRIQFETPENVEVSYEIAGLGSRFLAWVTDQLLLVILLFVIYLVLFFVGLSSSWVQQELFESTLDDGELAIYVIGFVLLVMGFANFFYFGLSELLMRGQTIGKKSAHVRVVRLNGYSLDAGSILIRNAFRVLDHIPLLWFVAVFTPKSQRLGDLVAGTICVSDEPKTLGNLRETLLARSLSEREFRFDAGTLNRLRTSDFQAVERILESLGTITMESQDLLFEKLCRALAERMGMEQPEPAKRKQFLEDLMGAEYRRQQRQLG